MSKNLSKLRTIIQESLRVQRGSAEQVAYIDTGNVLSDVCARQNHVIFARRGCGKTLLLQYSARQFREGIHSVYLNCEEFKRHSFPNVLIEILDALFDELEKHLSAWFGRKKRSKELIRGTSKNRRFPPPRKSDSRFSCSERERLAWDSLASSI